MTHDRMCSYSNTMPLVENELITLSERQISPPLLVGFVLRDLQFSVQCFMDHCLSYYLYCLFFFERTNNDLQNTQQKT